MPSWLSSAVCRPAQSPRCAVSRYGVVIASAHGNVPAPMVSAMNQACSTVSSTALSSPCIYPSIKLGYPLAAPLGTFGLVAGAHGQGVGFVGSGHGLVGPH